MDKRKEENKRVRAAINRAFFNLFSKKKMEDITVTEIVSEAGVARASFYRNYNSKDEVMESALRDMLQDMDDGSEDLAQVYKKDHVHRCFELFGKYEHILMEIHSSGFGLKILEALNSYYEQVAGDMPANSKERFSLYVFAGSLYNTAMTWLKDGRGEAAHEVAEVFCDSIGIS
ncbi:MAG: TetR/AcrR family transcriptional regulator [Lachnospiraceae bacterium]|nr:TetR/AcrR family transcriptional regulator [Lachnospiraceae bacterium]